LRTISEKQLNCGHCGISGFSISEPEKEARTNSFCKGLEFTAAVGTEELSPVCHRWEGVGCVGCIVFSINGPSVIRTDLAPSQALGEATTAKGPDRFAELYTGAYTAQSSEKMKPLSVLEIMNDTFGRL